MGLEGRKQLQAGDCLQVSLLYRSEDTSSAGTRREQQKSRMSLGTGSGLWTDPYGLPLDCPLGRTGPSPDDMTFIL